MPAHRIPTVLIALLLVTPVSATDLLTPFSARSLGPAT